MYKVIHSRFKSVLAAFATFCILATLSSAAFADSPSTDACGPNDSSGKLSPRSGPAMIDFTCPNCGGIGLTIDGYYNAADATYTWVFQCDEGHIWFVTEYVGILGHNVNQ